MAEEDKGQKIEAMANQMPQSTQIKEEGRELPSTAKFNCYLIHLEAHLPFARCIQRGIRKRL